MVQQIDPVFFIQPAASLTISLALILYWRRTRGFSGYVLMLSFAAYFLAIVLKEVVQDLTYNSVVGAFGYVSVGTGLYFGVQTSLFEVGLAYVFARYGARSKRVTSKDAVVLGLGLSFWENGLLLGALSLLSLAVTYALLASGGSLASTIASQLPSGYFEPAATALSAVALGTLERISSMMAHVAWGVLCVLSVATGKKRYLGIALPMGMIDATVPFAGQVGAVVFEVVIFMISVCCLGAAWVSKSTEASHQQSTPQETQSGQALAFRTRPATSLAFKMVRQTIVNKGM